MVYAHGAVSLWQRLRTVHDCIVLGEPPVSHCVLFPVMYTYATFAVLVGAIHVHTDNKYANFAYAPFATVGISI